MTDDQIRAWLKGHEEAEDGYWSLGGLESVDCLTELLQHRQLHRSIKWAVWVADQSADSGWTCSGYFPTKGHAEYHKARCEVQGSLVLPANEVPCLTAR